MENKKNIRKLVTIISVILLIGITLFVIFISKYNKKEIVPEISNEELLDYISGSNVTNISYANLILNNDRYNMQKTTELNRLYTNNEVFKLYKDYIGKEFVNEFSITSTSGSEVKIKGGNNKILVFTDASSDDIYTLADDYLYLGAKAKDEGLYEIYVINTDSSTFVKYIEKNIGHMLNQPTPEIHKFLEKMPDNFILFLNSDNIIECITETTSSRALAKTANYIYNGTTESYKIIRLFDTFYNNVEAATLEYAKYVKNRNDILKEYDSISSFNEELNYNYYLVDIKPYLNVAGLQIKELKSINNKAISITLNSKNNSREYTVKQEYGLVNFEMDSYSYNNHILVDDISVNFYGNNSAEIFQFTFMIDDISIGISSNESWNLFEMENIVRNFK